MQKPNLFGIFLKEKRQAANLSLRELADTIGVAHTYILSIENGSKAPPGDITLKELPKFCILMKKLLDFFMI